MELMAEPPAVTPLPGPARPGKSAYDKRIGQLVRARTEAIKRAEAAEQRASAAEKRVAALEEQLSGLEQWRQHTPAFADDADAKRLLAEYRNQLRRYHDVFVAMKEARHHGSSSKR